MNFLNGINRFLQFINDNWTSILVMLGLIAGIYTKITSFIAKSKEEKYAIAKAQIKEGILKMIADAELDFADWNKAGSIKRSQVIHEIYDEYPILGRIADQEQVTAWIDKEINAALATLREIVENNENE